MPGSPVDAIPPLSPFRLLSAHHIQALLASLNLSQNLLKATVALVFPPQEEPNKAKGTDEHTMPFQSVRIGVLIVLALFLLSLCIYGVCILRRKCKPSSTNSQATPVTHSLSHPVASVPAPQPPLHALARPNFKDTRSSTSTCSTACSTVIRDYRPPQRQPEYTPQRIRLPAPPASMLIKGDCEPHVLLSVEQFCRRQYADQ